MVPSRPDTNNTMLSDHALRLLGMMPPGSGRSHQLGPAPPKQKPASNMIAQQQGHSNTGEIEQHAGPSNIQDLQRKNFQRYQQAFPQTRSDSGQATQTSVQVSQPQYPQYPPSVSPEYDPYRGFAPAQNIMPSSLQENASSIQMRAHDQSSSSGIQTSFVNPQVETATHQDVRTGNDARPQASGLIGQVYVLASGSGVGSHNLPSAHIEALQGNRELSTEPLMNPNSAVRRDLALMDILVTSPQQDIYPSLKLMSFKDILRIGDFGQAVELPTPPPPSQQRSGSATLIRNALIEVNNLSDQQMLYRFIQSGAIADPAPHCSCRHDIHAIWRWLLALLVDKLNICKEALLRPGHTRMLQDWTNAPKLMGGVEVQKIVQWLRTSEWKKLRFRAYEDWIVSLDKLEHTKRLHIIHLVRLITATEQKVDTLHTHLIDSLTSDSYQNQQSYSSIQFYGLDNAVAFESSSSDGEVAETAVGLRRSQEDFRSTLEATLEALRRSKCSTKDTAALRMSVEGLPPDSTATETSEWLLTQTEPLTHDSPLFRDLPVPGFGDHSLLARCVRFSQNTSQQNIDWRLYPNHVKEIYRRTNTVGAQLLRTRKNIRFTADINTGPILLSGSEAELNMVIALRWAQKFFQTPYTAADAEDIVQGIMSSGYRLAFLLVLLTEDDKARFGGVLSAMFRVPQDSWSRSGLLRRSG